METALHHALRAGRGAGMPNDRAATRPRPTVVVLGGGGKLGSAVLEGLLGSGGFGHVRVLVNREFSAAMHGLEPLVVDTFEKQAEPAALPPTAVADLALLVFDRERHANGRESAFMRPQPEALVATAAWLLERGVRRLVVVMPHDPARLPQALRAGLANLDEQAVAALGFEHVVFMRPAGAADSQLRATRWLQRVADTALAQLRLMLPQSDQPVRVQKVAQLAVELALRLPASRPGTHILPPELVWQAAQTVDCGPLLALWLAGEALPALSAPRRRL